MAQDVCDMACDKPKVRYLKERSGWYHYERRVPLKYRSIDDRGTVRFALQTDSYTEARKRVLEASCAIEEHWESALKTTSNAAEEQRDGAIALAKACDFEYRPASELGSNAPVQDILRRVEHLSATGLTASKPHRVALLGGAGDSELKLSEVVDFYLDYKRAELSAKSADQMRRYENPRRKVMRDLIAAIGDKLLRLLSRDDMLAYRSDLADAQESGEISAATANKQLKYLGAMLKSVASAKGLQTPQTQDLAFKAKKSKPRLPFPPGVIQDRLLATGALDSLNDEARRAIFAMVETGMRPSEIVNIAAENIRLDAEVPHVVVTPTKTRELKTDTSEREIPLVGVSLLAFSAQPEGFPRYWDRETGLSALANKALRRAGIISEPGVTLYSLRHSFEDRMIEAGADERMRRELMGHRYDREKYGNGPSLAMKRDLLLRMAFQPPQRV